MERELVGQNKELSDYKYALDESSIVAITNQKGIIIHANDNFCKISKYSREELIGQDHRIVNSGYHSQDFIKNLWKTIANGKIWKGEIKNKAKDGTIYWVDTTIIPFLNEDGKPYQYVAIRADITKRKKSEEQYQIFFDSIDEGFCVIEMIFNDEKKPVDYVFLEINASFERQTGLKDAVGKRMREFAPDHEEYWFETFGKIALTGESLRFENRAEQLKRWYDVYAFPWGDPNNLQVAIIFNDISKRKQTEIQLQEANNDLESFAYSVAHDLRAPLRSVHGYAEMLNQDFANVLGAEGKRIIETIKHNASKMAQLIDDLLSFSRLGRKEINVTEIDMGQLTKDVLVDINKSINHKAEVRIGHIHDAKGDYNLLYQVMMNLISNAIKYSSKKEKPLIQISSKVKNGKIIFSVKDNGAGFDMKYADKLFNVFQRLHMEYEFEGTGVGLAIVYRIINKHGGKIWAEGKVDAGAIFYFTLFEN